MAASREKQDDQELVERCNDMLSQLHVPNRVRHWSGINSNVFVILYEGFCGHILPDKINQPKGREDDIHNCQAVIDSLSLDVLNTTLSHIAGEEVINGEKVAISNLLDVFYGLMQFLLDKITSDISTDNEDDRDVTLHSEDPDMVTSDIIDGILAKELSRSHASDRSKQQVTWEDTSSCFKPSNSAGRNSTEDLIKLGQSNGMTHTPGSLGTDKTSELIALGDSIYQRNVKGLPVTDRYNSLDRSSLYSSKQDSLRQHPVNVSQNGFATQGGYSSAGLHNGNSASSSLNRSKNLTFSRNGASLEKPTYLDLPSYSGYAADGSRDSTAEILKESGSAQRRMELSGLTNRGNGDNKRTKSPLADDSITSSVTFPHTVGTDVSSGQFDHLGVRPLPKDRPLSASMREGIDRGVDGAPHHTFTHHMYVHYDKSPKKTGLDPLSASLPISAMSLLASRNSLFSSDTHHTNNAFLRIPNLQPGAVSSLPISGTSKNQVDHMSSTAPALSSLAPGNPSTRRSRSFENLQNMMRDTVAMSRQAVTGSPLRDHHIETDLTDRQVADRDSVCRPAPSSSLPTSDVHIDELSDALRSSVQIGNRSGEKQYLYEEPMDSSHTKLQGILSPKKMSYEDKSYKRKVSFKTGRGTGSSKSYFQKESVPSTTKHAHISQHKAGIMSPSNERPRRAERKAPSPSRAEADMAETFHEYLMKYYGLDHRVSNATTSSKEDGYLSDGLVDYGGENEASEANESSDFAKELEQARQELHRKAKTVRFDDILDDSAPGRMGSIRRKLKKEDVKSRYKTGYLDKVYQRELVDFEDDINDRLSKSRTGAKDKEKEYKKKVLVGPKTKKYKPNKKYTTSGSVLIPRTARPTNRFARGRKRSASASPTMVRSGPKSIYDNEILPWLLEEFPYLQLSSEALQDMWKKSSRQIDQLSQAEQEVRSRKSKSQKQAEEAERRQQLLLNIMKKDLEHNQRVKESKERQKLALNVKSKLKEKRQQSVRCRKYYDEYQVRMRAKMLKKKNKEEVIFKKLFRDGLDIQKERIRELKKYAKEQREERAKRQQNELESLENFYRDRFGMLAEAMDKEKIELEIREKAQEKVLGQMKKELRKKMETEIRSFQEQLYRDEDDAYWRDLDAERLRHELNLARYQTKV